ncbi:Uncharacterized protein GY17_00003500 [Cryptosporidium hominis]|uniref:Uncharacterized protein n=1 Tax=Cryptosporidium hominis TaxID=237895 RepID=A0ABX5BB00_CRYHO|nr:Uncharacterized protein GY17_00003500 [Cryptosporidium hominis]|eukprot:PPS94459.1 Uncharacterized protein GY17_00003500 [Cryptosporidium hominis]
MNNMKFLFYFGFLVYVIGSSVNANDLALPLKKNKECEHCILKGDKNIKTQVKGAYLVVERETTLSKTPDTQIKPFNDVPQPPKVGTDDAEGDQANVKELSPTVGEVPNVVPEPRYIPTVKIYDSQIEDLSFPEDIDSETQSEESEDENEDELILTRLQLGGQVEVVSKRDSEGKIEIQNIGNLDLSCTRIEEETKPKSKSKLRGNKSSNSMVVSGSDSPQSTRFLTYDLLMLQNVGEEPTDGDSATSQPSSEDTESEQNGSNGRVIRKLASGLECDKCELCTEDKKCFYHNGKNTDKSSEVLDSDLLSSTTTTTTTTTIPPSMSDEEKSPFVSDDISNDEVPAQDDSSKTPSTETNKDIDMNILLDNMNALVKIVKEGKEESAKAQLELRKDRELLTKVILDLRDSKDLTQLYIQLAKLEMEISLVKQNIGQLKRDLEKAKSSSNFLTQYENKNNTELELMKEKAMSSKVYSPKLARAISRLEKKKTTTHAIQKDVSKRIESLSQAISTEESRISELLEQKKKTENIINKISSEERLSFDEVDNKQ